MRYQIVDGFSHAEVLAGVNEAALHGWILHSFHGTYAIVQKDSGRRGSSSPRPVSSYGDYYGDQREQSR